MRFAREVAAWKYTVQVIVVTFAAFSWQGWHLQLLFPIGGGEAHYFIRRVVALGFMEGFRIGALATVATVSFAVVLRSRAWPVVALMAMTATVSTFGWEVPTGTAPLAWWEVFALAGPFMLAAAAAVCCGPSLGWIGLVMVAQLPLFLRIVGYLSSSWVPFRFRLGVGLMGLVAAVLTIAVARWRDDDPDSLDEG
ncbi:MAG: hypothetical protein ACKVZ0_06825 [Gemmatimonadales bacterium]